MMKRNIRKRYKSLIKQTPKGFSETQIENLLQKEQLHRSVDVHKKEIITNLPKPVASQKNTEYIFIQDTEKGNQKKIKNTDENLIISFDPVSYYYDVKFILLNLICIFLYIFFLYRHQLMK